MTPVDFPEANAHFGPPPGIAESQVMTIKAYCGPLQTGSLDGAQIVVTAWRPDETELARLNAGHPLFLSFIGGLPPHFPCTDFQAAIHPR